MGGPGAAARALRRRERRSERGVGTTPKTASKAAVSAAFPTGYAVIPGYKCSLVPRRFFPPALSFLSPFFLSSLAPLTSAGFTSGLNHPEAPWASLRRRWGTFLAYLRIQAAPQPSQFPCSVTGFTLPGLSQTISSHLLFQRSDADGDIDSVRRHVFQMAWL